MGRGGLVPDPRPSFDEEFLLLEEVEVLGRVEEGFVVWDGVGYEVGGGGAVEGL